jgi:ribose transport system substrate-binding protein
MRTRNDMPKRILTLLASALLVLALAPTAVTAQDAKPKIGFLAGVVDPFYQVMELGVNAAAKDFGVDVVSQYPTHWGPTDQTPLLTSMVARGDLTYLITAPTDVEQMVAPLQDAVDAGMKVITVDTYLGDGDYVNGPVTFPLSYIGSDNVEGGRIAGRAIADALGGKGKVYIQNTNQGVSSVDARSKGFREAIAEYPDMEVVDEEWCSDDANIAQEQTAAVLAAHPDLAGIFAVNVFSAQGAGNAVVNAGLGGHVQVAAYDATKDNIELLNKGFATQVIAQKPFDMGYLAVAFAMADHSGVTSLPPHVTTGFAVINKDNVTDPEIARFIYQVP